MKRGEYEKSDSDYDYDPTDSNADNGRPKRKRKRSVQTNESHQEDLSRTRKQEQGAVRQRHFKERRANQEQLPVGDTVIAQEELKQRDQHAKRQSRYRERQRMMAQEIQQYVSIVDCNYLGHQDKECPFCGALFFKDAKFNCCQGGKVSLEPFRPAPEPLFSLLSEDTPQARFFRDRCKATNSAFAFASMQYNKVPVGPRGVQSEKVRGDVYHIPSSLYPRKESRLAFGNFYVYDAKEAAKQRSHGSLAGQLNAETVESLSVMFEQCNELSKSFRHMHEVCKQYKGDDVKKLKLPRMRLVNRYELSKEQSATLEGQAGQYHHPNDSDMVSVMYDSNQEGASLPKGLVVYPRLRPRKNPRPVSYYQSILDPLCYPLQNPYGECGWSHKKFPISTREQCEARRRGRLQQEEVEENILTTSDEEGQWEPLSADPNLEVSDSDEEEQDAVTDEINDLPAVSRTVQFVESQGELRPIWNNSVANNTSDAEDLFLTTVDDSGSDSDSDSDVSGDANDVVLERPTLTDQSDVQHERVIISDAEESDMVESDNEPVQTQEEIAEWDALVLGENGSDVIDDRPIPRVNPHRIPRYQRSQHKTLRRTKQAFVSMREYYNYHYQRRRGQAYHKYTSTRKLGQLHVIDVFTRLTNQRFDALRRFYSHDMKTTKSRLFKAMSRAARRKGRTLGMMVTVPKTVIGSPRYYRTKYQDAISMTNKLGKADLFITFTGNREWPEIKENITKGNVWADEPVLVNSVFKEKKKKFLDRVVGKKRKNGEFQGGIFGPVKAFVYSVEFQQRGIPHIHILVTLKNKLNDVTKVDKLIWGELPVVPDPSDPNYEKVKRLRGLVERYMMHSPCEGRPNAYCQLGKDPAKKLCNKRFPKKFSDVTVLGRDGYASLRRPDNGERNAKNQADNRYVVAYSPQLLSEFECHINVEVVTNMAPVRYIYKYILKGNDRILLEFVEKVSIDDGSEHGTVGQMDMSGHLLHPNGIKIPPEAFEVEEQRVKDQLSEAGVKTLDENGEPVLVHDETVFIKEMRATTCLEAAHHIAGERITGSSHTVVTLPIHLPDEETVYFNTGEETETARKIEEDDTQTKLKGFFELCQTDEEARQHTYAEIPLFYTYEKGEWRKRKKDWSKTIVGRIPPVLPRYLNRFALRLLIMNTKGPQNFDELLKVNGIMKNNFLEAAQERGLMHSEVIWKKTMEEGVTELMPNMLRHLFATILVFGSPTDPGQLWEEFKGEMYERKNWPMQKKDARALQHISNMLQRNGCTLGQFNLPTVDTSVLDEAMNVDEDGWTISPVEELRRMGATMMQNLNGEQRKVLDTLLESAMNKENGAFFLEGPGGSGKTYLYSTLHHILTSMGYNVQCCAHTGIASTNLPHGSTVHRTFGIPLQLDEDVNSLLELESTQAELLRQTHVFVWDEATMSDRRMFECVDRLLRAITGENRIFGGKLLIAGGDWRQLLPIVDEISDEGTLDYTLKASTLWNQFKTLHLTTNVRASKDQTYCELLEDIGNAITTENGFVKIPPTILLSTEEEVIDWVFGRFNLNETNEIKGHCLLTLDNVSCDETNAKVLDMLHNEEFTYKSIDEPDDERGFIAIPTETYNSLTPKGLPPHNLRLKINAIVILLRNLDVHLGLCNGSRMRVVKFKTNLIICENLANGHIVPIPRIRMTSASTSKGELAFTRTQFPIRLAFALTVNRSQGQTLDRMGLILRTPVFAHGQLYVAFSRVRSMQDVKLAHYGSFEKDENGEPIVKCRNIVYKEIL